MKTRFADLVLYVYMTLLFTTAHGQAETTDYLRNYEWESAKITAGFIPNKSEVVLGEPLTVAFLVKNQTLTNLKFWFGGGLSRYGAP